MDKTQIHKNPHDELRCAWTRPGIDPGLASFTVFESFLEVATRDSGSGYKPGQVLFGGHHFERSETQH